MNARLLAEMDTEPSKLTEAELDRQIADKAWSCCEANGVQCNRGRNCPITPAASACSEFLDDDDDGLGCFRGTLYALGITALMVLAGLVVCGAWRLFLVMT